MPTGAGTVARKSFISDTPFTCSAHTMPHSGLTFLFISVSWMPDATTASAPLSPCGNSGPSTRTSLSGISVWTPPMTTMPLMNSAGNGVWGIRPFIDLNSNRSRPDSIPDTISIDGDGTPLCMAGFRMVNWGYCKQKHSRKWRCPFACGKVDSCPCKEKCSSSSYGRCIYTKPDWDSRLYTPVPRGTEEYKLVYNNRTSCERVNSRVLNDYHLHDMGIHTKNAILSSP